MRVLVRAYLIAHCTLWPLLRYAKISFWVCIKGIYLAYQGVLGLIQAYKGIKRRMKKGNRLSGAQYVILWIPRMNSYFRHIRIDYILARVVAKRGNLFYFELNFQPGMMSKIAYSNQPGSNNWAAATCLVCVLAYSMMCHVQLATVDDIAWQPFSGSTKVPTTIRHHRQFYTSVQEMTRYV